MATKKRKTGSTSAKREYAEARNTAKRQVYSVILFAVSVFLLFVVCVKGENVWAALHNFLYGVFGFCAVFLPVILAITSVLYALNKLYGSIVAKVIESGVLVVLIGAAIDIFSKRSAVSFGEHIKSAYDLGIKGGGFLGTLIGTPLLNLFGSTGAKITIIILIAVFLMLITGTTLIMLFKAMAKPAKTISEHAEQAYVEKAAAIKNKQKESPETAERKKSGGKGRLIDIPVDDIPEERDPVTPDMGDMQRLVVATYHDGDSESPATENLIKPPKATRRKKSDVTPEQVEEAVVETEEEIKNQNGITITDSSYRFPPLSLLKEPSFEDAKSAGDDLQATAAHLVDTLKSFGVETRIINVSRGPAVTRYELQPCAGVKISKITNLADDIALNLATAGVRIEAPIPNKAAVGIEVPNKSTCGVGIREIIESSAFANSKSRLTVALGRDIAGEVVVADIEKMPHGLIAGATGSGKSVCINSIIMSLLYKASPDDVKLLMIDPKVVELGIYNGIPHLLVPVVTDPRKASGALGWAVSEMERRYKLFAESDVRNLAGYNHLAEIDDTIQKLPQIVIIIDELADLMMTAPKEVEESICRIAQKARAAGMHLIIATQRPSVDVVTGLIKANIPSRIAFTVSSQIDSRTILDSAGAEKLLGRGDMLFSPVGSTKPSRVQGCFVSDDEVEKVVEYVKGEADHEYDENVINEIERQAAIEKKQKTGLEEDGPSDDPMMADAVRVVVEAGQGSTSLLQRKLKLGYARAARIMDEMEERGIVGPYEGSKPRKVLISKAELQEREAMSDEI